MKSSELLK
ncbi:insulin-like growth factor binding protein-related [Schistosoma mansoni]|nr:insulin-like growth factor binding protein-related [Schistosoma mansoni]|eukprot:XP_018644798.1 insulin-like growth factor binding protein-related [Schistosoma mansoni]